MPDQSVVSGMRIPYFTYSGSHLNIILARPSSSYEDQLFTPHFAIRSGKGCSNFIYVNSGKFLTSLIGNFAPVLSTLEQHITTSY